MTIPAKILEALEEVQKYHPEITTVIYLVDQTWQYMADDGSVPIPWDSRISVTLLEDALDLVLTFPAIYHISQAEPKKFIISDAISGEGQAVFQVTVTHAQLNELYSRDMVYYNSDDPVFNPAGPCWHPNHAKYGITDVVRQVNRWVNGQDKNPE